MQWHPLFAQLLRPLVQDYYEVQTNVPVGDAPGRYYLAAPHGGRAAAVSCPVAAPDRLERVGIQGSHGRSALTRPGPAVRIGIEPPSPAERGARAAAPSLAPVRDVLLVAGQSPWP